MILKSHFFSFIDLRSSPDLSQNAYKLIFYILINTTGHFMILLFIKEIINKTGQFIDALFLLFYIYNHK